MYSIGDMRRLRGTGLLDGNRVQMFLRNVCSHPCGTADEAGELNAYLRWAIDRVTVTSTRARGVRFDPSRVAIRSTGSRTGPTESPRRNDTIVTKGVVH